MGTGPRVPARPDARSAIPAEPHTEPRPSESGPEMRPKAAGESTDHGTTPSPPTNPTHRHPRQHQPEPQSGAPIYSPGREPWEIVSLSKEPQRGDTTPQPAEYDPPTPNPPTPKCGNESFLQRFTPFRNSLKTGSFEAGPDKPRVPCTVDVHPAFGFHAGPLASRSRLGVRGSFYHKQQRRGRESALPRRRRGQPALAHRSLSSTGAFTPTRREAVRNSAQFHTTTQVQGFWGLLGCRSLI
jgi:hypothetical protein